MVAGFMAGRIIIADEHAIVRHGVMQIVAGAGDLQTTGASGYDELLALLESDEWDAVVMNMGCGPDAAGMIRRIRRDFPRVRALIFNTAGDADDVAAITALKAGASAYFDKETAPDELLGAIRHVLAGGTYLGTSIAQRVASELSQRGTGVSKPHERLSGRELEVFLHLAIGRSVSQIARRLTISVKTVSTHRARILDKTGFKNNAELIRYAILNRLV